MIKWYQNNGETRLKNMQDAVRIILQEIILNPDESDQTH